MGIQNPYPDKEVKHGSETTDIVQAPTEVNEDVVNIVLLKVATILFILVVDITKPLAELIDFFYISRSPEHNHLW